MPKITGVKAREILDSRGNPTVEVDIITEGNILGRAGVPSGASTGEHEALELRDKDKSRYLGKGVRKAVRNITQIIRPKIIGMEVSSLREIDELMIQLDGTEKKEKLGANAILGVSLACARAAATASGKPFYKWLGGEESYILPVPCLNIINGGKHADNNVDLQEFMIVPLGAPTFAEAMRYAAETYHHLKKILKSRGLSTAIGDEGGFAPNLNSNEEAFQIIMAAIKEAGYRAGEDISLGLDAAASSFYEDGKYLLKSEQKKYSATQLIDFYENLVSKYPIVFIEDGLAEDDWDGWKKLTERLGKRMQLTGDDLFVTNPKRLERGIESGVANSILIKVNQIGTLTETLDTIKLAQKSGYKCLFSHRSGETEDSTIADLVVATGTGQIKTGAPARSERLCKYNQLIRIEEELGKRAIFKGKEAFS